MFIDDILSGSKPGMQAPVFDVILFWREWGFSLRDLSVPIHFWHGGADNIVPLAHAKEMASLVPGATVTVRPGEPPRRVRRGEEVLGVLLTMWDTRSPAVTVAGEEGGKALQHRRRRSRDADEAARPGLRDDCAAEASTASNPDRRSRRGRRCRGWRHDQR